MRVVAAEMVGPALRARMDPLARPARQVKMAAMDSVVGRAAALATAAPMAPAARMEPVARMARTAKPALRGPWEQLAELGKRGSLPQMQTSAWLQMRLSAAATAVWLAMAELEAREARAVMAARVDLVDRAEMAATVATALMAATMVTDIVPAAAAMAAVGASAAVVAVGALVELAASAGTQVLEARLVRVVLAFPARACGCGTRAPSLAVTAALRELLGRAVWRARTASPVTWASLVPMETVEMGARVAMALLGSSQAKSAEMVARAVPAVRH